MKLEWMEDYIALIEQKGFARAAEKRAVTQPTFSRRIQALEDWVGVSLVDRSTHTIRLTPAGEAFKSVAEKVLREVHLGRDEARAIGNASLEKLRFASTHALSLTFFPNWLRQLEKKEPSALTVELTADHMVACEKLMIEGQAQFLLCHHHEDARTRFEKGFMSKKLGMDTLLPVAAPELAQSYGRDEMPLLAFADESGMGRIIAAARRKQGFSDQKKPVFTSHLASVLAKMARDGRGMAWTARSLIEDDLEDGSLVTLGDPKHYIDIEIRLWRSRARQSPAAEAIWRKVDA